MNPIPTPKNPDPQDLSQRLLDVLIRAGLILALAVLCYRVFAPFMVLTVWALILAVGLYPMHQALARLLGGRQGLAATAIAVLGVMLIVVPTAVLLSSMGDTVHQLVKDVQHDTLRIPPPGARVAEIPLVGDRIHAIWSRASSNLPGLVQSLQPKIGELARTALTMVASIGGSILQFIAAFIIASIILAFGEAARRNTLSIFNRVVGVEHGAEFTHLSATTIRAVAQGVLGVALIQAIVVGLSLLVAGVPWAGLLAVVVLVLDIAQVPAMLVTLPAIAYLWMSGDYGSGEAVAYTVLLFVSGLTDNVLRPLMMGRGVDAPMPVILLGALGGMAAAGIVGIVGMFVGATLLALGYQIFMRWVAANPDAKRPTGVGDSDPVA